MATLAVQSITRAGLTPAFTAAAGGGDQFTADERTYLVVKNGSGAGITVTCAGQQVPAPNLTTTMPAVTVPAGQEKWIGPFPAPLFADTNGNVLVTYSAVTTVTVGAVRVSAP
jgi:hypothetical protein